MAAVPAKQIVPSSPIITFQGLDKEARSMPCEAFGPHTALESYKEEFKQRRDFLLPALKKLGFKIEVEPQGAFYIYANCEKFTKDSYQFAYDLLEKIGVAITPGKDFGDNKANRFVRFAYTTSLEKLKEGIKRLNEYL